MVTSASSQYIAPITLAEDLIVGATVSGTINGTEVEGTVRLQGVTYVELAPPVAPKLSSGSSPIAEIDSDDGGYIIVLSDQPETDLTINLTQTVPAQKVTIPEEYLELTEMDEAIADAKSAAETAQTAANAAQNVASRALNGLADKKIIRSIYFDADSGAFMTQKNGANYTFGAASANPFPNIAVCYQNSVYWGDNAPRNMTPIIAFLVADQTSSECRVSGVALDEVTGACYKIKTNYIALNQSSGFSVTFEEMAYKGIIVKSSTSGSTKKFRITVDDTGTLSATEVTE